MELNWNEDFSLGLGWELDFPYQLDGLSGDIKSLGQPKLDSCFMVEDAHDALMVNPIDDITEDEDFLGSEWMESKDLDSYLDEITCTSNNMPEESSSLLASYLDKPPINFLDDHPSNFDPVINVKAELDVAVSPPDSPALMAPVINIVISQSPMDYHSSPDSFSCVESIESSLTSFADSEISSEDFTSSNLEEFSSSVDSLNISLCSDQASVNKKIVSLIQSSPELYKVIAASELVTGGKGLSTPKNSKRSSKSAGKNKQTTQHIPEHIFEQLNKKDKKKLQNKNAAIRYRQKKKEEACGIKTEEQQLEEVNLKLKNKVDDLQREIKYMKNLMDDVYRAKGLL